MTIPKMLEDELFATNPPDPVIIPTPAEYAYGFVGGPASRDFFNGVFKRLSELTYRNQVETERRTLVPTYGTSGLDGRLLYRNFFNATAGTDALNITANNGTGLENESGSGLNKYFATGRSTLAAATNDEYPLYANCGQDATNMRGTAMIVTRLNPLSADGDFFAMSFHCIGRYERTDIGVEVHNSLSELRPFLRRYDNAGVLVNEVLGTPFDINIMLNKTALMRVKDRYLDDTVDLFFILDNIFEDFGESIEQGTLSNKHGFTFSAQTFELASITFNQMSD